MTIGTFLDISTCFITKEDNDLLELEDFNFPSRVIGYAEGFVLSVCEPEDWPDVCDRLQDYGMSQEFINLYEYALTQGCWLLRLDCDGDDQYDFPKFAW